MTAATLLESVLPKTIRNAAHRRRHSDKDLDRQESNDSNATETESEQEDFEHIEREHSNSYDHIEQGDYKGYGEDQRHSSVPSFVKAFEQKGSQTLSPEQVVQGTSEKQLGGSTNLSINDFELLKTLGTGTFARVWLARFKKGKGDGPGRVFALKVLRKADVIRLKQVEHAQNERTTLAASAGHPFITTLVLTFKDPDSVYMLLDYCPGGEVFTYLRRAKRFNEATAKFYAAEIVLIFEFLHDMKNIVYRDLKPENILLDDGGHVRLVDFGFAKVLGKKETYTLCGTPEYLAPEVIKNTGHGIGTDWWALGILIYEFLVGQPPFWDQNPMKIYNMIVECKLRFPTGDRLSEDAQGIISDLVQPNPSQRLGCIDGGARTVKQHPWFADIDWNSLYNKKTAGPIVPKISGAEDSANFDTYPDEDVKQRREYTDKMRRQWDSAFDGF